MQVTFNAKERTLREIVALALSAGWRVTKVTRAQGSLFGHILAVPVDIPSCERDQGVERGEYGQLRMETPRFALGSNLDLGSSVSVSTTTASVIPAYDGTGKPRGWGIGRKKSSVLVGGAGAGMKKPSSGDLKGKMRVDVVGDNRESGASGGGGGGGCERAAPTLKKKSSLGKCIHPPIHPSFRLLIIVVIWRSVPERAVLPSLRKSRLLFLPSFIITSHYSSLVTISVLAFLPVDSRAQPLFYITLYYAMGV
jgi:hypothetical protein